MYFTKVFEFKKLLVVLSVEIVGAEILLRLLRLLWRLLLLLGLLHHNVRIVGHVHILALLWLLHLCLLHSTRASAHPTRLLLFRLLVQADYGRLVLVDEQISQVFVPAHVGVHHLLGLLRTWVTLLLHHHLLLLLRHHSYHSHLLRLLTLVRLNLLK